MTLNGRIVLVTGGAKRIGRAIAIALAQRRAHVVISYRSSSRDALATVRALKRCGGAQALAVRADLSRSADVRRLMARIRQRFGRLDILVNSAAAFPRTPFATLTERDWDAALDTNLKGPFLCALYSSRLMKRRGGKIINLADWARVRPYRDSLPYCVPKAGVIGLTKALAKELAPSIQVNAIAPGQILPPEGMSARERTRIVQRVPLKRWGRPEDIVNTVLFLIEGTDFMTGSTIFVDGGQLIA